MKGWEKENTMQVFFSDVPNRSWFLYVRKEIPGKTDSQKITLKPARESLGLFVKMEPHTAGAPNAISMRSKKLKLWFMPDAKVRIQIPK